MIEYTYMIKELYSPSLDKNIIYEGIKEGLESWSELNSELVFKKINEGTPRIVISLCRNNDHTGWIPGVFEKSSEIKIALVNDSDGKQFDKNDIRNKISHEFGHELGLLNNTDESSVMYSKEESSLQFNCKGYRVPKNILKDIISKELNLNEYLKLDKQLMTLYQECIKLHGIFKNYVKQRDEIQSHHNELSLQYDNLLEHYKKDMVGNDKVNLKFNELEMKKNELNEIIKLENKANNNYNNKKIQYNNIRKKI